MSEYEDPADEGREDERPRDPALDRAIERLRSFFTDSPTRPLYGPAHRQRISGHKTLIMVERYAHANGAHIRAAMDKLEGRYRKAG